MIAHESRGIAHAVQDALRKAHESGLRARVQASAVVKESGADQSEEWYYVPVEIAPYAGELGTFYELFSRVEESLESQGMRVLLVPVRRETPAGEIKIHS